MNQQSQPAAGGSGLAPNVASLLCYVCTLITGIVFLVIEKNNKDVRFHAWQAIILGVSSFVIQIGLTILAAVLGAIASFLGAIIGILSPIVWLAFFVVWIICMIKAYQGERYKIPFLGDLAEKQANS
ncbi:MAG TPA: hypothetical protein DDW49_00040 [Deltaproteobacteria bacterium]|nr:MAG: hypothetical protein A2048_05070 [Deltaproteobacteria bacterium GWA2_45_12]HBF11777.1 hypothetical protein [Deltaproteobacteria bacterium]